MEKIVEMCKKIKKIGIYLRFFNRKRNYYKTLLRFQFYHKSLLRHINIITTKPMLNLYQHCRIDLFFILRKNTINYTIYAMLILYISIRYP